MATLVIDGNGEIVQNFKLGSIAGSKTELTRETLEKFVVACIGQHKQLSKDSEPGTRIEIHITLTTEKQ